MRIPTCIAVSVLVLGALCGCDNEENIIGCRLYNHIYEDRVGAGTEYDTVYVFFAAGYYEEFRAPLTFSLIPVTSYADSIVMELSVYGISPSREPEPYTEIEWRSDTLLVWYSGAWPYLDYIDFQGLRAPATPPCPSPYYRIDHVIVFHPADIVVYPHEDVLH
jgi:hypothetical protein